jgi:hypothetical protein
MTLLDGLLSPLRGSNAGALLTPGLAPWAAFHRRSAAYVRNAARRFLEAVIWQ